MKEFSHIISIFLKKRNQKILYFSLIKKLKFNKNKATKYNRGQEVQQRIQNIESWK